MQTAHWMPRFPLAIPWNAAAPRSRPAEPRRRCCLRKGEGCASLLSPLRDGGCWALSKRFVSPPSPAGQLPPAQRVTACCTRARGPPAPLCSVIPSERCWALPAVPPSLPQRRSAVWCQGTPTRVLQHLCRSARSHQHRSPVPCPAQQPGVWGDNTIRKQTKETPHFFFL